MSAVLGPIHYWLYNKIGYQEELTRVIADYAISQNWISDGEKYTQTLPALETVIDEGNIHGWLQARIADAETRYADLVMEILVSDSSRLEALCSAAYGYGEKYGLEVSDAQAAYKSFENFFVNGMPCDRINRVTEDEPDRVSWQMAQDIHAPYWNGDSGPYYRIRKSVMEGMLNGTPLKLQMPDTAHYSISL